jgi:hypothetical protein
MIPYLNTMLGPGFKVDHSPCVRAGGGRRRGAAT